MLHPLGTVKSLKWVKLWVQAWIIIFAIIFVLALKSNQLPLQGVLRSLSLEGKWPPSEACLFPTSVECDELYLHACYMPFWCLGINRMQLLPLHFTMFVQMFSPARTMSPACCFGCNDDRWSCVANRQHRSPASHIASAPVHARQNTSAIPKEQLR